MKELIWILLSFHLIGSLATLLMATVTLLFDLYRYWIFADSKAYRELGFQYDFEDRKWYPSVRNEADGLASQLAFWPLFKSLKAIVFGWFGFLGEYYDFRRGNLYRRLVQWSGHLALLKGSNTKDELARQIAFERICLDFSVANSVYFEVNSGKVAGVKLFSGDGEYIKIDPDKLEFVTRATSMPYSLSEHLEYLRQNSKFVNDPVEYEFIFRLVEFRGEFYQVPWRVVCVQSNQVVMESGIDLGLKDRAFDRWCESFGESSKEVIYRGRSLRGIPLPWNELGILLRYLASPKNIEQLVKDRIDDIRASEALIKRHLANPECSYKERPVEIKRRKDFFEYKCFTPRMSIEYRNNNNNDLNSFVREIERSFGKSLPLDIRGYFSSMPLEYSATAQEYLLSRWLEVNELKMVLQRSRRRSFLRAFKVLRRLFFR